MQREQLLSEALLHAGKARTMAAKLFNDPQASQVDAGDLLIYMARLVDELCLAAAPAPAPQWVPVSERLPDADRKVLATYTNELGNRRTIVARWTPAKTVEADTDDDEGVAEYDEATDTFYLIEGWWEVINNWGDYSQVFVNEGKVDHWMPLPAAPEVGQGKEASNARSVD